ncbi:hypothetical protein T05_3214 [Trichinella murrelli]|uniref:Uncharacterized protein n=1 Tax=Trichinella murrelli TaxID=144512 RepID=A0A0V0TCI4_9BILA|nr:hypothetical protein T05_3214 [Trichinella murrelli]
MGFNCREVNVRTTSQVAFVVFILHECQWSGVEGGFYFTESCPEFFFIKKRLSEDLSQRFLDRADEALPVASHPRGSLRDEFPVDAVAYQLTLDSVHVHVSPELPQLRRSGFERAKIIRLDDLRSSSPGDEPSERLHHSGRRHLWDQLQMHCP